MKVFASGEQFRPTPDQVLSVTADDGVALHVEIDGVGSHTRPTVVMSHGFALSSRAWVLQRTALAAAGYRVVAWDQRCHGQSGRSAREHCSMQQLGADLAAVISAVAPDGELALIGHSMGGMTVMALAAQQRELFGSQQAAGRVSSVALVATSAGEAGPMPLGFGSLGDRLLKTASHSLLGRLERRRALFDRLRSVLHPVEFALVKKYSFASEVSAELVELCSEIIFQTPLDVIDDFLYCLDEHNQRATVPIFQGLECVVITGGGDLLTPPADSEQIMALVPNATHLVIPDAGHMLMLEHPDLVTDQLLSTIEQGSRRVGNHLRDEAGSA